MLRGLQIRDDSPDIVLFTLHMLSVLQFSSKWNGAAPHISPEATLSYKRLLCKHWNEFSVVPIEIPWNAVSCWFVRLHQNNENTRRAYAIMQ